MSDAAFTTPRLILRAWRESDRAPFAAMNADPAVMRFYPTPLPAAESDALVDRIQTHFARHGFGMWAAEIRATGEFAGYIGLGVPRFEASFTPCVEAGWRLAARFWNQGLATEGARAVLRHAMDTMPEASIVSFTARGNLASRRVMEKIGLVHDPSHDFLHPSLPANHPLAPHVLYRAVR